MASNIDLHSTISIVTSFTYLRHTGNPIVGNIIDTNAYDAIDFVISLGLIQAPNTVYTPELVHGDLAGLGDGTIVPIESITGTIEDATFAQGDTGLISRIGYVGKKRYVRLSFNVTDAGAPAAGDAEMSGIVVRSSFRHQPSPDNAIPQ